jgi:hypothetical protein
MGRASDFARGVDAQRTLLTSGLVGKPWWGGAPRKDGTHEFSRDYAAHSRAVTQYQIRGHR